MYTEYISAESEEEAMEKFDNLSFDKVLEEPFDEIICQEIPLCHEEA